MAFFAEFPDLDEARAQARKALNVPIGMSSPLWLAFGAATTAGVAWWWMTRWTRPINVEAMAAAAKTQVEAVERVIDKESEIATSDIEAAAEVLEAPLIEPRAEPVAEPAPVAQAVADDLTVLVGIGPKLAAALAERGVTTFAALAAWTTEDGARFDAELSLKGRVARDAWIAQAKRLAS